MIIVKLLKNIDKKDHYVANCINTSFILCFNDEYAFTDLYDNVGKMLSILTHPQIFAL